MRAPLLLVAAIASEVVGTTALKLSDGFTDPLPSLVVVLGYGASFYALSLVLTDLPVGVVYATWAALGIVATATVGVLVFDETLDLPGVAGITFIIAGVVVLALFSDAYTPAH
ncbi:DMT family transporter [Salarchaeum japonicum]|uniref:DMT family transporter n=1 Tax=Salarchaeum japonicum TaxID=555573 RepID=UPI003C791CC6